MAKDPECFEVLPENWEAVKVFLSASSQWFIGFAGPTGLNYQSIDFLFKIYSIKNRKAIFEDIQIIEGAALKEMRDREEKSKGTHGT